MDQKREGLPKKITKHPRSFWILIGVFVIICALLTIKFGSDKQKIKFAHNTLELPDIETGEPDTGGLEQDNGWTVVTTQPGDSLAIIFKRVGLSSRTLGTVLKHNPHANLLAKIKPQQQIQFLIHEKSLEKLIFPVSTSQYLVVTQEENKFKSKLESRKMSSHNEYLTATIQGSLYGTAKRLHIPYKLIQQMTEIFSWELNFIKDLHAGDQLSVLYEAYYIDDKLVTTGDILAVSVTSRGKKHQAVRHMNTAGDYDYYTPEGLSLKKAFTRYPIKFSHISSAFSLSRYHPILHYRRPHRGVDLAASIGTPIHAVGDGRIEIIERNSGYGNMIRIAHSKQYASIYAHLLKFQRGLSKGDHVKRGQVIGYVGQSGLADGPHCHFEFHVNHQPRNPATIALPQASPVSKREMASFLSKAHTLLAQLKLYEDANLVSAGKKNRDSG